VPKVIVTETTMPLILHELDKWQGKLTWELFTKRVALAIGEKSVGRHALLEYDAIKNAYADRKKALKEKANDTEPDVTLDFIKKENETLKAKVARLEEKNELFKEQFVRWLENIRKMPGIDLVRLNETLDKPLPKAERK
jgi:hypothetical protein